MACDLAFDSWGTPWFIAWTGASCSGAFYFNNATGVATQVHAAAAAQPTGMLRGVAAMHVQAGRPQWTSHVWLHSAQLAASLYPPVTGLLGPGPPADCGCAGRYRQC